MLNQSVPHVLPPTRVSWARLRKDVMTKRASLLALALLGVAQAQTYNNATLNAKYYFRELYFVTDATGNPTDVRSAGGAIVFDGKGGYSIVATQNIGTGNSTALTVNGT